MKIADRFTMHYVQKLYTRTLLQQTHKHMQICTMNNNTIWCFCKLTALSRSNHEFWSKEHWLNIEAHSYK